MSNIVVKDILKIFRSYNFMGNRIKNVKVDTPIHNEHPTPKVYVDEKSLYNTEIAQTKQNSTKFNWLTSLYNKPIKQVLDELLFNESITYNNPSLIYGKFIVDWSNIVDIPGNISKIILFENQQIKGSFVFNINLGSRTTTNSPKLYVEYPDLTNFTFNTEFGKNEIIFDFQLKPGTKIYLQNTYNAVVGAEGEIIPVEFSSQYSMSIDVTNNLLSNVILFPSVYINNGDELVVSFDQTYIDTCKIDNKLVFDKNDETIVNLFIPNEIINKILTKQYPIFVNIFKLDEISNKYSLIYSVLIQNEWLTDCGDIDISTKIYKSYQMNIGVFNYPVMIQFDFSNLPISDFFVTSDIL